MLTSFIWQAAQKASWMLWEEEQKASGMLWEVQSLSRELWQNPEAAPAVEARLNELTNFEQGPSKVPLRDAISWMVVELLEQIDISEQTNGQKQTALDAVARHVCPGLCADQDRRSKLFNAVHKNLDQLMRLGQHMTSSFDVPSASRTGAAKKKSKGGGKQRRDGQTELPEDTDSGDSTCLYAEACEAERLWEVDIEEEFLMGSASIADAVHVMPFRWLLAD